MQRSHRHKLIIRSLGTKPISVEALAELTGVSAVTIRRDLAELESQGMLNRVHGGATKAFLRGTQLPYSVRAAENPEEKIAISGKVAELVQPNMSLIFDDGSTMAESAHSLPEIPVTALCISLRAALPLTQNRGATVITPGGQVLPGSLRYEGTACMTALRDFRADIAFHGACSASAIHGVTAMSNEDAQIKQGIFESASRSILLVTSDKFARTSCFKYADLEMFDDIVTTDVVPDSVLDELHIADLNVHVAKVSDTE